MIFILQPFELENACYCKSNLVCGAYFRCTTFNIFIHVHLIFASVLKSVSYSVWLQNMSFMHESNEVFYKSSILLIHFSNNKNLLSIVNSVSVLLTLMLCLYYNCRTYLIIIWSYKSTINLTEYSSFFANMLADFNSFCKILFLSHSPSQNCQESKFIL